MFLIFKLFTLYYKVYHSPKLSNSVMFFNNGQIGDLFITSIIIENEENFKQDTIYYILIRKEYANLFINYKGKFKFILYDLKKYRSSIIYRFELLNKIRNIGLNSFYNLCAGRGMLTEEISLLSGANQIICLNRQSNFLKPFYESIINKYYLNILFDTKNNEYIKTYNLISLLTGKQVDSLTLNSQKLFNIIPNKKKYIVISPTASDLTKTWGLNNYYNLIKELSKNYAVFIVGGINEVHLLNYSLLNIKNVFNLTGKTTITQTAKILSNSSLFIGNDSGITHLAIKLNIPIVAVIGGGAFKRFYVNNNNKHNLLYHKMECFNCQWNCIYKEKYCLTSITVNDVLKAVDKYLSLN